MSTFVTLPMRETLKLPAPAVCEVTSEFCAARRGDKEKTGQLGHGPLV